MRKSVLMGLASAAVAVAGWSLEPLAESRIERLAADRAVAGLRRTQAELERTRTPRAAREAVPALLAGLDGLIATSPRNPELLEIAARGNTMFAFTFLEEEDLAWAKELHEKALLYARRALVERDEALARAVVSPVDSLRELPPISEREVPALFWLAFAWGSRINLERTNVKLLGQLGQVDRAMRAVLERDETFFYGGPHLYFAVRYGCLTRSMGGDPEKARRHFEAVDRLNGDRHLFSKLLRAKYLSSLIGTPRGDRYEDALAARKAAWDDFYGSIVSIVDAREDIWPEQRLANEVARERARRLGAHPEDANVLEPEGVENRFAEKARD